MVDTGRDRPRAGAARAYATVAGALRARSGDDRAETVARGTRAGRADVAEQRTLHVLDGAVTVAGATHGRLGTPGRPAAAASRDPGRRRAHDLPGDAKPPSGQPALDDHEQPRDARNPAGVGEPVIVPFTDAAVPEIDMAARRMVVVPLTATE